MSRKNFSRPLPRVRVYKLKSHCLELLALYNPWARLCQGVGE
ncbi:hypothetical protein [Methanosarcina sp. KYL-1]|nr:hypothetical protein [Methanosarcina sp. KYL-1]